MRKLGKVVRGLAAGLALAALIGGGAWALWHWGRLGVLLDVRWDQILSRPDDGSLILGLLTAVGWVAWAWMTGTVICEAVAAISRGRWRPGLPGASWLRPAMAFLVMSVLGLAMAASSLTGGNRAASSGHTPQSGRHGSGPASDQQPALIQAAVATTGEATVRPYVVRPGDDLWSLAERFAGGGDHWRALAVANQTVVLDPGVDLVPGTMLMVPVDDGSVASPTRSDGTAAPETSAPKSADNLVVLVTPVHPADNSTTDGSDADASSVQVQPGDTLWGLAGAYLGDPLRWPELFRANSAIITDPALIHPGQVLVLPGAQGKPTPEPEPPNQVTEATSIPHPATVDLPQVAGTIYETSRPEIQKPGSDVAADGPSSAALDSPESIIKALLGSIGAGLAAAMIVGLAGHRLIQLRNRPLGRALPRVPADAQRLETVMDRRAAELLRRRDDEAADDGSGLVAARLEVVAVTDAAVTDQTAVVDGKVLLGAKADGSVLPLDLAGAGLVALVGDDDQTIGLMAALAGQVLAIDSDKRPDVVIATPALEWLATLLDCPLTPSDQAWLRLRQYEKDGALMEPLVVFDDAVPESHWTPRNGVTVVTACTTARDDANVVIEFVGEEEVRIAPDGTIVTAQLVLPPARRVLTQLVDAVTSADYPPAPWWRPDVDAVEPAIAIEPVLPEPQDGAVVSPIGGSPSRLTASTSHPRLDVLGPVDLVNARGGVPDRATRQCLEYCGWLLRYPGQTSVTMVRSLLVAEGTRRSNVSRLRLWLGSDDAGEPYLPDAHSGRIRLHPGVTSDWERLQALISGGVNQVGDDNLTEALRLVRGAPLADAAPGQWHWAEEWRCDMVATIRDVGVVLASRALQRQDLDLARWAASRALLAAPEDDRLMAVRIRTEYLAGNQAEVDRLALHVSRMARMIGYDLPDFMVNLLQEVIEGAPRLREAA